MQSCVNVKVTQQDYMSVISSDVCGVTVSFVSRLYGMLWTKNLTFDPFLLYYILQQETQTLHAAQVI